MSLIVCPECGQQVSNSVDTCIHCGYRFSTNISYTLLIKHFEGAEQVYALNKILSQAFQISSLAVHKLLGPLPCEIPKRLSLQDCVALQKQLQTNGIVAEVICHTDSPTDAHDHITLASPNPNTVSCPRCGSTQITTGQRGYKLLTGFLGSSKTVNRCANCGYKWEPSFWTRNR